MPLALEHTQTHSTLSQVSVCIYTYYGTTSKSFCSSFSPGSTCVATYRGGKVPLVGPVLESVIDILVSLTVCGRNTNTAACQGRGCM